MEESAIVEYEPTEIIKISVGDLTVPVNTAIELSKLATVEKGILVELLKNAERVRYTDENGEPKEKIILHPDTLPWAKELRMILKDIHDLSKGVQEKALLKRMDIVGEIYKTAVKNMDNDKLVQLIRELDDGKRNTIEVTSES